MKERENFYDVIVSDFEMPGLNGIELLKEVRKNSNTPFIIFTGKGREEVAIKALNLGADFYVQKSTDSILMYTDLYHHITKAYEKNRAEIDLVESRDILAKLPIGMIISDREGNVLDGNDKYLKIVNMTKEELLNTPAVKINPERNKFLDLMEKNGKVTDFKATIKRKSSNKRKLVERDVIVSSTKMSLQNNDYYLSIVKEL